jgi:AcrR family transcriptional regulator
MESLKRTEMSRNPGQETKRNRKAEILAATERLLRERGLTGVTTRAIAEAVPCSEGAIYVHFASRVDLLLAVLEQNLPAMLTPLHALEENVGRRTVERNLLTAMEGLLQFHGSTAAMLSSLFAEPELLARFRSELLTKAKGPKGAIGRIASYVRAEQQLGRIGQAIDPEVVASLLMSSSFFSSFTQMLTGQSLTALKGPILIQHLLATGMEKDSPRSNPAAKKSPTE